MWDTFIWLIIYMYIPPVLTLLIASIISIFIWGIGKDNPMYEDKDEFICNVMTYLIPGLNIIFAGVIVIGGCVIIIVYPIDLVYSKCEYYHKGNLSRAVSNSILRALGKEVE